MMTFVRKNIPQHQINIDTELQANKHLPPLHSTTRSHKRNQNKQIEETLKHHLLLSGLNSHSIVYKFQKTNKKVKIWESYQFK